MSLLCETPNESFMTSLIYQADSISPEFWRLSTLCRVLGIKDHCTLLESPSLLSVDELQKWREKLEGCSSDDSISFLVAESAEMTVTDWFAVILSILFDEWELRDLCFSMISVLFRLSADPQIHQTYPSVKRLEAIRLSLQLLSREERELLVSLLSVVSMIELNEE